MMDRLSDLPDGILHQIFSCLPTEEVVKTSVLSKRWNGLWLSSPVLYFDTYLRNDITKFINQTIIFRGSTKVLSFRIRMFPNRVSNQDLDLWIRYALQNEAEQLLLDLGGDNAFYLPPQFLYFSSSFTSLRLCMCRIWLRKGVSWTSLKTLVLRFAILVGDAVHQVLLGCPLLESLELDDCACYDVLNIYSTSLKRLVISDSSTLLLNDISEDDMEISAPNIECICLSGDLSKEVLEGLQHVRNLKLGEWCIKLLAEWEKKGLPSRSLKCKSLTLNTSFKQEDIAGILLLLKCSPALETLTLNINSPEFDRFIYESEVGQLGDFCNFAGDGINCLQVNLRTINITRFTNQNLVLPFIACMLKEARVLNNMEIRSKYVDPDLPLDSFFNVARELSDMPKSSPNVVVKLHNSDGKVTLMIS